MGIQVGEGILGDFSVIKPLKKTSLSFFSHNFNWSWSGITSKLEADPGTRSKISCFSQMYHPAEAKDVNLNNNLKSMHRFILQFIEVVSQSMNTQLASTVYLALFYIM